MITLPTVDYSAFMPHIMPYAPNCPKIQAVNAIRNACIEFCKDTNYLQQELDAIYTIEDTPDYDIDVPRGYVLGQIEAVYYQGRWIPRKSREEIESRWGLDWNLMNGVPQCYTQFDPDTITLVPMPDTTGMAVTGKISIVPERESTSVDSVLLERYAEEIADGALARLCATPGQGYTDKAFAMDKKRWFKYHISTVKAKVRAGNVAAPLQVYLPRTRRNGQQY